MPPPRPVDPRRLQKKTSRTMLAAQRRDAMETNRLARRLADLQAGADWGARSWGRDYRAAEQQLSLGNLVLSDHVIDVAAISGDRPRAPSAEKRRRQLAKCLGEATVGRQRRPASVFGAQIERQREKLEEDEVEHLQQQQQKPLVASEPVELKQPQARPVTCQFAGSDGAPCRRFPCCLPPTYSFMSNKREMLQLYDLLLSHLPEHRRPQSGGAGSSDTGSSDMGSLISDAEYLVGEQRRVSTLDPVERARILRQSVDDWKRRHARQQPQPRETRYGKPYPMRRILKPISCSTSFFLN